MLLCLLSMVIVADILSAQGDINIYFSRTISYYQFFPSLLDPLKTETNNFSLTSNYRATNYYTINPMSLLTKIKRDTKLGVDGNTFVTYQRYETNDILIPSTVSIEYYTDNKVENQRKELLRDQIVSNFKMDRQTAMDYGNKLIFWIEILRAQMFQLILKVI